MKHIYPRWVVGKPDMEKAETTNRVRVTILNFEE